MNNRVWNRVPGITDVTGPPAQLLELLPPTSRAILPCAVPKEGLCDSSRHIVGAGAVSIGFFLRIIK